MMRRTVILVEGDPSLEEMVQEIVEQLAGADVVIAPDVDQAESLVRDSGPALVIVDEDSAEGLGERLLGNLKSDAETRDIPLVVLCGDGDIGRQLVSLGAEAFLPKPFDVDDLLALVQFYAQAVPRRYVEQG